MERSAGVDNPFRSCREFPECVRGECRSGGPDRNFAAPFAGIARQLTTRDKSSEWSTPILPLQSVVRGCGDRWTCATQLSLSYSALRFSSGSAFTNNQMSLFHNLTLPYALYQPLDFRKGLHDRQEGGGNLYARTRRNLSVGLAKGPYGHWSLSNTSWWRVRHRMYFLSSL